MKTSFALVLLALAASSAGAIPAAPSAAAALHPNGIPAPRASLFAQVNLACGVAPIPPNTCRVGPCQCDANGLNCQWTFICR